VLIAATQSLSGASDDMRLEMLVGVIVPASGWDAAGLSFQGSTDGTTFSNLFTTSGELTFPSVAAGTMLLFDSRLTAGVRWLKVRSGTAASPVAQSASRTILLVSRDLVR
jgi:hypothetical protein